MNKTTSDQSQMKELGLNPAMVEEYSDVSLEPVSFTKESNLGHSTAWCAEHSATWNFSGAEIEVEGHTVIVDNQRGQSFNDLLNAWRKQRQH